MKRVILHFSQDNIETETVRLARTQLDSTWPSNIRVERQFEASQLWDVRVPVPQAQAIVDLAVKAGANQVEEVDWQVKDTASLEARANSAALAKARALAAQLASGLEAKMGELLYVSNTERKPKGLIFPKTSTTKLAMPEPQLKLFPKKVEQEATVHAIFAIE